MREGVEEVEGESFCGLEEGWTQPFTLPEDALQLVSQITVVDRAKKLAGPDGDVATGLSLVESDGGGDGEGTGT